LRVGNRFGKEFCKSRERSETGLVLLVAKELKEMEPEKAQNFCSRTAVQVAAFPSAINNH